MQTTAIRTVAYSLPENDVILLTLLISMRYIPYTDLRKNSRFMANRIKKCRCDIKPQRHSYQIFENQDSAAGSLFFTFVTISCLSLSKSTTIVSPSPTEARIIISAISSSRYFWMARFSGRAPNWMS